VLLGVYRLMLRGSSLAEQMHFVPVLLAAVAFCAGVGRVCGELLLEALSYHHFQVAVGELDDYGYLFYIGGITNLLGIVLLFGWHEEGRQSLADWLRATKRKWLPAKETTAVPFKHPLD
jgi:hypothetical protein